MIPLNLDDPVLDSPSGAAALLEGSSKGPDGILTPRNTGNDADRLPPPPLALPPDPDDAVRSR